ncbi:MAG TPA: M20 family peptidase [Polyangiaceae bacterium]|nr:M20 family peptidase [Polyangiaceae bacterium]
MRWSPGVKKVFLVLFLALGALASVLVVKAFRRSPLPRVAESSAPGDALNETAIAEHLAAAIRFRTVSHQDPKDDDRAAFAELRKFLTATYQRVHVAMTHETVNGDGLLYRWPGTDEAAEPILFLAHQDVVPIEPGTEAKWTHPPFDGAIADGFVWGRGAIDDKGSLICLFEAFESLLAEGWIPARTIWFASGFDEEVGGRLGAKKIAEELRARNVKFAWILDEGGAVTQGVVPHVERLVASIAVSEKGYLSLELTTHAQGGHASLPPRETAIGILAMAIDRLQKNPLPARITPAFEKALEVLAPEMPFAPRLVLSNLWLTSPLILRGASDHPETSAMVRTTTAPTIVQGGVKDNVLPSTARAVVNFRVLPGESIATVMAFVQKVIGDDRVIVAKLERSLSEPAPFSSTERGGYEVIRATLHDLYPDAVIVPGVMNGATDSRHFQGLAADIYRFLPTVLAKSDLPRIHGTDERVSVTDLSTTVRAYRGILQRGAAARPAPAP